MTTLKGQILTLPKMSGSVSSPSSLGGNIGAKTINIGEDGATFIPSVSSDGIISWTNDKDLTNPEPVNIKGEKGDKGDPGEPGADGKDGKDGQDGYTPQKGVDYFDGQPGKDGADGKDGSPGADGSPGKDGTSATHSWNGTTLTITSASGTSSADLKGDKGDRGDQGEQGVQGIQGIQGPQGEPGAKGDKGDKGDTGSAGTNGKDGKDGTSVTVKSMSESSEDGGSNVVTFSDGKTLTIRNGSKGSKGEKGDAGAPGADGAKGEKGDKGDTGATGQRGTGLLPVTTAPASYATAVGGITPKYRMAVNTIQSQAGVTEVLLGDTVRYSYYHYPIAYLDGSYAYFTTRVSIRGATGATGKTAYAYAQDGGYTGTEAEFAEKLASEYTPNPLYGKKVSFLGDSICAGSSESTSYLGGYGRIIADRNGMVYENVAHGGATVTAETYSRTTGNAKPWLCRMVENMSADADYAIIEGGINDGWDETVKGKIGSITEGYNATLDDTTYYGAFESMLKQLVTKFQGKKIGYIAVPKIHGLYDSSQNAPNFYHIALECCAKWGVSVCDLNTITPPVEYLSDLGTEYTADACHPTYEGYLKYYCDPIEAWMRTLTTGGGNSAGMAIKAMESYTQGFNDAIQALQTGKLDNTGISFRKARLPLADGTTIEIDVLTAVDGSVVIPFINQLPISIDTDKTVYGVDYNGDGKNDGYKKCYRLSASSGSEKEEAQASITGFIAVNAGDKGRFQYNGTNTCWDILGRSEGFNIIAYYDSSFVWLGSVCPVQNQFYGICTSADKSTGSVKDGGIVSFTVPSNNNIAYMRLSIAMDWEKDMSLSDLIITVNEEIT